MTLSFPYPCRSFDATRSRVCCWGYDRTIEISFFVGEEVLKRLCLDLAGAEAGFLKAFDAMRDPIHEIAGKVYARADKGSIACLLAAEDI
jgi:hypothetical protein